MAERDDKHAPSSAHLVSASPRLEDALVWISHLFKGRSKARNKAEVEN